MTLSHQIKLFMNDTLSKIVTGAAGIGGTELVQAAAPITPDQINSTVGLLGQIIIAIATIISLFKKRKQPTT